jgi:hypothetical protein
VVFSALHVLLYILTTGAQVQAGQVQLRWEDPNNPAEVGGYTLYYWQATWDTPASVDVGDQTTYTLRGLENGMTYYFAVTTYSRDGEEESAYSDEITATISAPDVSDRIIIEAEAMTLTGYRIQWRAEASDRRLITRRGVSGASSGRARAVFHGSPGIYEVIVAYFDERDGQSTLKATINGRVVDTWVADEDLPGKVPNATTLAYRVVAPRIALAPGHVIVLEGKEHANEYAMIDWIELIPVLR